MPSREFSRNTPDQTQHGRLYKGWPGEEQQDRRLHVNQPGYHECPSCGNWVSLRRDGCLRTHVTKGLANVTCVYKGMPRDQTENAVITYTITIEITREVTVPNINENLSWVRARQEAIKGAVLADIPEEMTFKPDGERMGLRVQNVRSEVVTKETSDHEAI